MITFVASGHEPGHSILETTDLRHSLRAGVLVLALTLLLSGMAGQPARAAEVLADGNGCNSNDATAPCFAQNSDILSGQRSLLPVDDIVLSFPQHAGSLYTVMDDFILKTSNLAVASRSTVTITSTACTVSAPWPAVISVVGRMFHLTNDVVVTLTTTGNGCEKLLLWVRDPQNATNDSKSVFTGSPRSVQIVMGDFNGDGYQDIFFVNQSFAQVITAKCPGNPFESCTETPSDGLIAGPQTSIANSENPAGPPVVGDFNGDGALDVAWPSAEVKNGAPSQLARLDDAESGSAINRAHGRRRPKCHENPEPMRNRLSRLLCCDGPERTTSPRAEA